MNRLLLIDDFVNSITMYRFALYALIVVVVFAIFLGFLGVVPFGGLELIKSLGLSIVVCWSANWLLSKIFRVATNVESWIITSLILFCLFFPPITRFDAIMFIVACVVAMASKYIFTIKRQHIFNPAALAAVVFSFNPNTAAAWWVGTDALMPVVLIAGLLVVRKMRKFGMFFAFIAASFVGAFIFGIDIKTMFVTGPLLFLGTIMLTEPMTMPPNRRLQMIYGAIVGGLYVARFHIGFVYSTPELALIVGNIFSYLVGPKVKYFFSFRGKREIAGGIYEFEFDLKNAMTKYRAGQYLEWMLPHEHPDSRGVRRFFSIASSPTRERVKIGVRIGENCSTFKKKLLSLEKDDIVIASQLAGDFVLPDDKGKKLIFVAGGIGVTPFRSMVEYLIERGERRDIVLLYFNKREAEIAYRDIFDGAREEIGLKTVYVLTDREHVPGEWKGEVGRLDEAMLSKVVPDFMERVFYISGPSGLVNSYRHVLLNAGVSRNSIKTDYFSGY